MKQTDEKKERVRKEYAPRGQRGQKMIAFRCDLGNVSWLEQQANKGRYINELIAADKRAKTD